VLISDRYREMNQVLHRTMPNFGTSGQRYAMPVQQMMSRYNTAEILDYGCGKRTLEHALGFPITNYDPCVPGLEKSPGPHDIVVCTDVLEHIEPECLDDVLSDIRRCTKKAAFLLIATRPAQKTLSDGRNAHLIQEPYPWWKAKLEKAGFVIREKIEVTGEFAVVCETKGSE
jgi:hypothetical protein